MKLYLVSILAVEDPVFVEPEPYTIWRALCNKILQIHQFKIVRPLSNL